MTESLLGRVLKRGGGVCARGVPSKEGAMHWMQIPIISMF